MKRFLPRMLRSLGRTHLLEQTLGPAIAWIQLEAALDALDRRRGVLEAQDFEAINGSRIDIVSDDDAGCRTWRFVSLLE